MYGISSSGKDSIDFTISKMFDRLAYRLLGRVPKLKDKSHWFLDILAGLTLSHIFIQALGDKEPNAYERDVLKSILNSSFGYIESLKNKTSSNVVEAVDALVKEAKLKNTHVDTAQVETVVAKEMVKARAGLKLIAEAEATKTRNLGHTMEIASKSKEMGVEDPVVFFIIIRSTVCPECMRLHMLEDQVTPKVYKMSELSMGYHKRGDNTPSALGEHPFCHCSLTQLPPGWGFKNGYLSFIGLGYSEYDKQSGI